MTKQQREQMKRHRLVHHKDGRVAEKPWINGGEKSSLLRCLDCDWLGWFPAVEVTDVEEDRPTTAPPEDPRRSVR
jgi:hypothetical protein